MKRTTKFQSKVIQTFGSQPLGLSPGSFGLLLWLLILSPLPWMLHHGGLIMTQAGRDGKWTRGSLWALLAVVTIDWRHPHLRRSKWICLGSLVYFLVLAVAWGTYERRVGIK